MLLVFKKRKQLSVAKSAITDVKIFGSWKYVALSFFKNIGAHDKSIGV